MRKEKKLSDQDLDYMIIVYTKALDQIKRGGYILEGSPTSQLDMLDFSSNEAYYDISTGTIEYGEHYYNGGYAYPMAVDFSVEYLESMLKHYQDLKAKHEQLKQKKQSRLETLKQITSFLHRKDSTLIRKK